MGKKLSILVFVIAFVFASITFAQETTEEKRPGYMGINMELKADLPNVEGCEAKHGVVLTMVTALSPAQKAGLKVGDIVYAVEGKQFDVDSTQLVEYFRGVLGRYFAGDTVKLNIIREMTEYYVMENGKPVEVDSEIISALEDYLLGKELGTELVIKAEKYAQLMEISVTLGDRYDAMGAILPSDKEIYPNLAGKNTPVGEFGEKLVKHYDIEVIKTKKVTKHKKKSPSGTELTITEDVITGYDDMRNRLANLAVRGDGFKLDCVSYVQRNPFQIEEVVKRVMDPTYDDVKFGSDLDKPIKIEELTNIESIVRSLKGSIRTLTWKEKHDFASTTLKTDLTFDEHIKQIEQVLKEANDYRDKAFAALSSNELKFIEETLYKLGEKIQSHIYIHINFPDEHRSDKDFQVLLQDFMKLIEYSKHIDYVQLYNAQQAMLQISEKSYIEAVINALKTEKLDLTKKFVFEKDTPFGKIAIAGTGRNEYGKFVPSQDEKGNWKRSPYAEDYAVLIDLGGDDFYANNAGSSNGKINCALLVDVDGNDAYESTRDYVQGTGFMGTGALVDYKGDDSYIGINWAQATAMMGIGVLMDYEGNDTYRAQYLSQAAGIWGVAHLMDRSGDDKYEGHCYMQGLGMPKCVAILEDIDGNDNYYCKGRKPSSYGTLGLYEGWGQGAGLGLRMFASGGVGILNDKDGKDKYEVGIFGQGGGYYHGWGILYDGGDSDDVYIGGRYAQGFAAHQAIGTFIEDGGNDKYYSRNGVMAGLSWDETVVLFIDKSGDDWYQGGGFSLGATAHNGVCIFKDLDGKDYYGTAPGRAGGNDYHGGSSLSVFIDLGGQEDTYAAKGANNKIQCFPEFGIIADLKTDKLKYDDEMLTPMQK